MKITVLGSGSEGNSTLIETHDKKILIDVGFSYKHLKEKLEKIDVDPKGIKYLLLTHEHYDHTKGLKVFLNKVKPELYIKEAIKETILENNEYNKITYLNDLITIDELKITVLPISHDVIDPVGFMISEKKESLVYITDTGYINHKVLDKIKNKTYYILESNHDTEMLLNGPYPIYLQRRILSDKGHLSNDFCGEYLSRLIGPATKQVILAHISKKNNTPELALATVKRVLRENEIVFDNISCASMEELVEIK